MSVYRYEYDSGGNPPDEHGRYDEETRVVMGKNVSESLILDRLRSVMGPTATQLHARQRESVRPREEWFCLCREMSPDRLGTVSVLRPASQPRCDVCFATAPWSDAEGR